MPGRNGMQTRRSGRVTLRVPLRVYEPGSNNRFLVEEAYSVKVSLWGGLIALRTAVNKDQKLSMVNQAIGETADSEFSDGMRLPQLRLSVDCHPKRCVLIPFMLKRLFHYFKLDRHCSPPSDPTTLACV